MVRTRGFHPRNRGSIPRGVTYIKHPSFRERRGVFCLKEKIIFDLFDNRYVLIYTKSIIINQPKQYERKDDWNQGAA